MTMRRGSKNQEIFQTSFKPCSLQYYIVWSWVTQHYCSLLHVVHHGITPLSCFPGARWFVGGHATFFSMLNSFVHMVMYTYYMIAAMGPEYQVERALHTASPYEVIQVLYRVKHQIVPKLLIQGQYGCCIGPESRVWEQPDVSPCKSSEFHL